MALSPADFAAYSRATGAPYPESPQERAELAPEVLAFRRGQLTQPEQQSNLPAILGGTVLGLGALGAALAGTRRFARGTKTQSTPQRDLGIVRQAATGRTSGTTAPRTPAPPTPGTPPSSEGVAPSKVTAIPQATVDLTDLTQTDRPLPFGDPWTGEAGPPTPLIQGPISAQQNLQNFLGEPTLPYKRTDLSVARTPGSFLDFSKTASGEAAVENLINDVELKKLVSQQRRQEGAELGREAQRQMRIASAIETEADEYLAQLRQESLSQQAFGALQSGEDQMIGRTMRGVQRNEDLDSSQVNSVVRQLGSADAATSITADGIPVDQTEGFREFSQRATQRKNLLDAQSQMWAFEEELENQGQKAQAWLRKIQQKREPLLDIDYQVYDLIGSAAEKGVQLEPSRALSLLKDPTIELTGTEQRLFGVDPLIGKFALKGQTFEPRQQQTGAFLGVQGESLKSIQNVGETPGSGVSQAASGTSIRGRSRIPNVPDDSRPRLSSLGAPVTEDVVFIDEGGTVTVSPGEELTEIVFESKEPTYTRFIRDPQASQPRPKFFAPGLASAEQLKQGLKEEYAPKGMRAVQTAEGGTYFVPIGDPGGIGIYGEERSFASGPIVKFDDPEQERVAGAYTKTAMRAPTEMPFKQKQKGGANFNELSSQQLQSFIEKAPQGTMRVAGQKEQARRERVKQSLLASELSRRATIEGRDPQMILRERGFNV